MRPISARITERAERNWSAEIQVRATEGLGQTVTIEAGGQSWSGYVVDSQTDGGRVLARVVGGAGGISASYDAQQYVGGTLASIVAQFSATMGEVIETDVSIAYGSWLRSAGSGRDALDAIARSAGVSWWVDRAGVIQLGERSWSEVYVPVILSRTDSTLEAADAFAVSPGTVCDTIRIYETVHRIEGDTLRSTLSGVSTGGAMDGALDRLRRELRLGALWPCTVVSQSGSTLVVRADDSDVLGANGLARVPLYLGVPGAATLAPGARVLVTFLGADPARPAAVAIEHGAASTDTSVTATVVRLGAVPATAVPLLAGSASPGSTSVLIAP